MGWLKKILKNPLQGMRLTPQKLLGGRDHSSMKNPYENVSGMQQMQKPPVNLGPKPMEGSPISQELTGETIDSKPYAKPFYEKPAYAKPLMQDQAIGQDKPYELPIDPQEEYFAANAARMKPMAPDMYSMRKNREADKMYQKPRTMIR